MAAPAQHNGRWHPVQHPAQKVRSGTTSAAMADNLPPITRQFNPALISQYVCVYYSAAFHIHLCTVYRYLLTPGAKDSTSGRNFSGQSLKVPSRMPSSSVACIRTKLKLLRNCKWKNATTCNITAITRPVSLTSNWSVRCPRNSNAVKHRIWLRSKQFKAYPNAQAMKLWLGGHLSLLRLIGKYTKACGAFRGRSAYITRITRSVRRGARFRSGTNLQVNTIYIQKRIPYIIYDIVCSTTSTDFSNTLNK